MDLAQSGVERGCRLFVPAFGRFEVAVRRGDFLLDLPAALR